MLKVKDGGHRLFENLLGQAEHDPNSGVALVCLSERFGRDCLAQVEKQLETLPTREIASQSWADNGRIMSPTAVRKPSPSATTTRPSASNSTSRTRTIIASTSRTTARFSSARKQP